MTIAITILIALLGIYLDYSAYRRMRSFSCSRTVKRAFMSVVAISYLLVVLTPLMMYLFIDEHNCTVMMKISMWLLTAYLTLSIPRLLFSALWLISRKRYWLCVCVVLSSLLFATFLFSIFITRTDYKVNEVQLQYENLPSGFNGYRLAFISDIHTGSMVDAAQELQDINGIINSSDVDAVLLGGDIINIHHSEINDQLLFEYSRLKARDGVYMVLGNHDTGAYVKNSTEAFRKANMDTLESKMNSIGWVVLRDSTVYIYKGEESIAVTGIDYSEKLLEYKHSMDAVDGVDFASIYKDVPDSLFNITISHLPQLWHSLCDNGYSDLTLSGHIHAMQMKYFSLSPARFMYKEWSGLYEREKGKVYINDGIGCVGYLARFGARPEITVIELHCKE